MYRRSQPPKCTYAYSASAGLVRASSALQSQKPFSLQPDGTFPVVLVRASKNGKSAFFRELPRRNSPHGLRPRPTHHTHAIEKLRRHLEAQHGLLVTFPCGQPPTRFCLVQPGVPVVVTVDEAIPELPGRRPDIIVRSPTGRLICLLEVYHCHEVDQAKESQLLSTEIPCVEIDASFVAGWTSADSPVMPRDWWGTSLPPRPVQEQFDFQSSRPTVRLRRANPSAVRRSTSPRATQTKRPMLVHPLITRYLASLVH